MKPVSTNPPLLAEQLQWAAQRFEQTLATDNPHSSCAVVDVGGRPVHVKSSDRHMAGEAAALQRAGGIGEVQHVTAARFLGYDPQKNLLFSQPAPGASLFNAIWNSRSNWQLRAPRKPWDGTLIQLGDWLDALHQHQPQDSGPANAVLHQLVDEMHERLTRLADCGHPQLPRDKVRRTGRLVDAWAGQVDLGHATTLWIHGDMALNNILFDPPDRLTVLDFGAARPGLAVEDFTRLWSAVWELTQVRGVALPQALEHLRTRCEENPGGLTLFRLCRLWNTIICADKSLLSVARYNRSTQRMHDKIQAAHLNWLGTQIGNTDIAAAA